MVIKKSGVLIFLLLVVILLISGRSPQLSSGPGIPIKELFVVQSPTDCIVPTNGMTITSDTTFCSGTYYLPDGITISGNDVVLDCNDATLFASPDSYSWGIYTSSSRITIFNCNLEDYSTGIMLNWGGQSVIQDNVITGGNKGINIMQSNNNQIINNIITDQVDTYDGYGIYSALSEDNVYIGNSIQFNDFGISLQYASDNNELHGNTICSNYEHDIYCRESDGNTGSGNIVCDGNLSCLGGGSSDGVYISQVINAGGNKLISGRTYTLQGAGFGLKNPVEPILFDTVDNQDLYNSLNHGDVVPTRSANGSGYPWWSNGYSSVPWDMVNDNVKYWETDNRVSGRPHYHAEGAGFLASGDFDDEVSETLYVNWWLKVNYNLFNLPSICTVAYSINTMNVNTKLLKLWPGWVGEISSKGRMTLEADDISMGDAFQEVSPPCVDYAGYVPQNAHVSLWDDINDVNEWHNMEVFVNNSGYDSGVGHISTWSDGVVENEDLIFCSKDPQTLVRAIGVHTYKQISGGLPDDRRNDWHCFEDVYGAPLQIDFGDIYIDNTLAKVMVCDFGLWSERDTGHCEMQLPKITWDVSTIEFESNRGTFGLNQPLYIYVMNADGVVNEGGYGIEFSTKGDSDVLPPAPHMDLPNV